MRIALTLLAALIVAPVADAARPAPTIAAALAVEVSCETTAELDARYDYGVEGYAPGGRAIVLRERRCRSLERVLAGWRPTDPTRQEAVGIAVFVATHELEHVTEWESGVEVDENRADCLAARGFQAGAARFGIGPRYSRRLVYMIRGFVGHQPTAAARCF